MRKVVPDHLSSLQLLQKRADSLEFLGVANPLDLEPDRWLSIYSHTREQVSSYLSGDFRRSLHAVLQGDLARLFSTATEAYLNGPGLGVLHLNERVQQVGEHLSWLQGLRSRLSSPAVDVDDFIIGALVRNLVPDQIQLSTANSSHPLLEYVVSNPDSQNGTATPQNSMKKGSRRFLHFQYPGSKHSHALTHSYSSAVLSSEVLFTRIIYSFTAGIHKELRSKFF